MTHTNDEYAVLAAAGQANVELQQCELAFADIREGLFHIIESHPDRDKREQAVAGLQILKSLKQALIAAVAAGQNAENTANIRAILAGEDQG